MHGAHKGGGIAQALAMVLVSEATGSGTSRDYDVRRKGAETSG